MRPNLGDVILDVPDWYSVAFPYNIRRFDMARKPTVRPGGEVPDSGIYESSKSKRRATLVKREPAPPTPEKGEIWKQVVDTNKEKKPR